MRKVIFQMMISLDGYFEASEDPKLGWHTVDQEFSDYSVELLKEAGTLIFGRTTYEMMYDFWPSAIAREKEPVVAEKMNTLPKIVFSRTLEKADWHNTVLIKNNLTEEISRLKQEDGNAIIILGSSNLAVSFLELNLLDELRVIISPTILGSGKTVFAGISDKHSLKLLQVKVMGSGNVLLYYEPVKQ
ncbi:dihydrofolate reductase family protein [Chitinophaga flava]|uniref:Riboflavin biosynthesis protein RibD n=1 Tax=Chitinophaga flava TaxID=2259036 RepID=A0A365Y0M3_9BACT|nr:dihydrofolate reductase family protein [Chitinophaga flava]RBL91801.1 riboflavin biosynthesis protein RibD [Chitinophaga flava]